MANKKAAEAKLVAVKKAVEAKRLADDKLAEAKVAADEQAAAEAKRAAEEKATVEARVAAEAKHFADVKTAAAEAKLAAKAKRLADETVAAEAKRLDDEKAVEEAKHLAATKAAADATREKATADGVLIPARRRGNRRGRHIPESVARYMERLRRATMAEVDLQTSFAKAKLARRYAKLTRDSADVVNIGVTSAGSPAVSLGETDALTEVSSSMQIYVINQAGSYKTTTSWVVQSSDSIDIIKGKLQDTEGIPADQQLLMFEGKQLKAQRSWSDYGVPASAFLVLYHKDWLSGGMNGQEKKVPR